MITNIRELFLVNIGLIHVGANFHSPADEQFCRLVENIRALDLPTEMNDWFCKARTRQVEVNPFYPRGSDLAAACFFLQDGKLNKDAYYSFLEECGTHDPIGESDFREWMEHFTEILLHMLSLSGVISLWYEYENIIAERSEQWRDMVVGSQNLINGYYGNNAPELAFCPNLFNQYLADFVRLDNRLIVIAAEPNAEAMLHEALHPLVAECRSLFMEYADKHGITLFADEAAMLQMGYMADTSAESKTHVLEECFVRALSVTLSGGGSARADFHKNSGFRLTAYLAERFGKSDVTREIITRVVNDVLSEYTQLQSAIQTMTAEITAVLADITPTIYLYGSVALGDFRLGWSDIDILVLTNGEITQEQADKLIGLRQTLLEREPGNAYYRSFEGGMLDLSAYMSGGKTRTVYWGTSGQRITDSHILDSFSVTEALESGILLHGEDVRDRITPPTHGRLRGDVMRAYETIRKYAQTTNRSIISYGWLLDIARGIYTLRTGKVIAKTAAGEWALENNLCQNAGVMQAALLVRKNPLAYKDNAEILVKSALLGEDIQRFADVLEREFQCTTEMFARGELSAVDIEYTALTAMQ
jgi:predicted nucleotidyltransferase